MKYGLEIVQTVDGESNVVAVDALGELTDGELILKYTFDDADYMLQISENAMAQSRGGVFKISMEFIPEKVTQCRIFDGENGGSFNIHTTLLSVKFENGNCRVECEYCGDDGETTRLEIFARELS
ncbi:MAG: DUF1934 family protein [Clostridia bacterium]|nr:DUF1934 family protein [Clostridia bacterium]